MEIKRLEMKWNECTPNTLSRDLIFALFPVRHLQKARLKHVNAVVLRDQLRNELAKQQRIEEEMREKREQQRLDIAKLNLMINQAEEQMVRLRKRYETAVQHRNDRLV